MPPRSRSSSNSSSDSLLARAFEESVRLQRHQEHSTRERELREREREESILEESRRTFLSRSIEEENEEEAQLRLAMERSSADEQERAARRQREREERARLDREFGGGGRRGEEAPGGRRGGQDRRGGNESAPAAGTPAPSRREERRQSTSSHHPVQSPPRSPPPPDNEPRESLPHARGGRRRNMEEILGDLPEEAAAEEDAERISGRRRRQSGVQYPPSGTVRSQERPSRAEEASGHRSRRGRGAYEARESGSYAENSPIACRSTTSSQSSRLGHERPHERISAAAPRCTYSDRPRVGEPVQSSGPNPERHRHHYRRHQHPDRTGHDRNGPLPDPSAYSLPEILTRSRTDAYPTSAPFTEAGLEFNHHELQAAINASAEQGRDPDEEAIERNLNCPTYEEACAMARYRPRRGDRYVFQGPNAVTIEGDEDENKPDVRMEIVGEMDLVEAMRVANRGRNRNGDRNTAG